MTHYLAGITGGVTVLGMFIPAVSIVIYLLGVVTGVFLHKRF